MQRDIFGRLLAIALNSEKDPHVGKLLTFPLTPVPLAFCHLDGTICKTDKSALVKSFGKEDIEEKDLPVIHCELFDGFFLLHTMKASGKVSKFARGVF